MNRGTQRFFLCIPGAICTIIMQSPTKLKMGPNARIQTESSTHPSSANFTKKRGTQHVSPWKFLDCSQTGFRSRRRFFVLQSVFITDYLLPPHTTHNTGTLDPVQMELFRLDDPCRQFTEEPQIMPHGRFPATGSHRSHRPCASFAGQNRLLEAHQSLRQFIDRPVYAPDYQFCISFSHHDNPRFPVGTNYHPSKPDQQRKQITPESFETLRNLFRLVTTTSTLPAGKVSAIQRTCPPPCMLPTLSMLFLVVKGNFYSHKVILGYF